MFGIGKLPKIPGSYASLVTVIFLYILFDSNPFIHITIKHNTYQLHLIVAQTTCPRLQDNNQKHHHDVNCAVC